MIIFHFDDAKLLYETLSDLYQLLIDIPLLLILVWGREINHEND